MSDIQVRALEDGIPYPTLTASVLHKYVTGRLPAEFRNKISPAQEAGKPLEFLGLAREIPLFEK